MMTTVEAILLIPLVLFILGWVGSLMSGATESNPDNHTNYREDIEAESKARNDRNFTLDHDIKRDKGWDS